MIQTSASDNANAKRDNLRIFVLVATFVVPTLELLIDEDGVLNSFDSWTSVEIVLSFTWWALLWLLSALSTFGQYTTAYRPVTLLIAIILPSLFMPCLLILRSGKAYVRSLSSRHEDTEMQVASDAAEGRPRVSVTVDHASKAFIRGRIVSLLHYSCLVVQIFVVGFLLMPCTLSPTKNSLVYSLSQRGAFREASEWTAISVVLCLMLVGWVRTLVHPTLLPNLLPIAEDARKVLLLIHEVIGHLAYIPILFLLISAQKCGDDIHSLCGSHHAFSCSYASNARARQLLSLLCLGYCLAIVPYLLARRYTLIKSAVGCLAATLSIPLAVATVLTSLSNTPEGTVTFLAIFIVALATSGGFQVYRSRIKKGVSLLFLVPVPTSYVILTTPLKDGLSQLLSDRWWVGFIIFTVSGIATVVGIAILKRPPPTIPHQSSSPISHESNHFSAISPERAPGGLDRVESVTNNYSLQVDSERVNEPFAGSPFSTAPTDVQEAEGIPPSVLDIQMLIEAVKAIPQLNRVQPTEDYFPFVTGQLAAERYLTVTEMGQGAFGSVLLGIDVSHLAAHEPSTSALLASMIAMKISRKGEVFEAALQRELSTYAQLSNMPIMATRVPKLIGGFSISKFIGFALTAHGTTLLETMKSNQFTGFQMQTTKSIVRQLLEALQVLHTIGIIHCDVKPENILWQAPAQSTVRIAMELAEAMGWGGAHSPTGRSPTGRSPTVSMESSDIVLVDLGTSRSYTGHQYTRSQSDSQSRNSSSSAITFAEQTIPLVQTREYRAPEVLLGYPSEVIEPSLDVWSVACVAFELLTGSYLFDPKVNMSNLKSSKGHATNSSRHDELVDLQHIALIHQLAGESVPRHVLRQGAYSRNFFEQEGKDNYQFNGPVFSASSVDNLLQEYFPHITEANDSRETELFSSFVQGILRIDPGLRPSVSELLGHPWLTS